MLLLKHLEESPEMVQFLKEAYLWAERTKAEVLAGVKCSFCGRPKHNHKGARCGIKNPRKKMAAAA